ncbi:MAG TPA: hypothetical protein VFR47_13420 [Anaerolineales bacterium]|nr:hypothetical protein [Anaerolineales bacterium]
MKQICRISIVPVVALFMSACGASPAVPTINAVDVQSTAVAAALTIVAQTQAAIPTETPLLPTETPTETPPPTDTPQLLPTVALAATFTPVAQNTVDPCSTRILASSPRGRETTIHIINTVKSQVTVSLYLNETASWGECGYRSYVLAPRDSVLITDLVQGCYDLWAFNSDPENLVNAYGAGCINNPDKWTFEISTGNIKFFGP